MNLSLLRACICFRFRLPTSSAFCLNHASFQVALTRDLDDSGGPGKPEIGLLRCSVRDVPGLYPFVYPTPLSIFVENKRLTLIQPNGNRPVKVSCCLISTLESRCFLPSRC